MGLNSHSLLASFVAAGALFMRLATSAAQEPEVVARDTVVEAADNADPQANDLEAQYLPQVRQVLLSEMYFMDVACLPTQQQRKSIAEAGEKSMREAVKKFVDVQRKMMNGQWRGNQSQPDCRELIRAGLVAAVQANLSTEQAASYQAEIAKRRAQLKRVAAQNLVAKLDDELVLTAAQREKLLTTLTDKWQDAWVNSLQYFLYDYQFLPTLPDHLITPLLNETQKQVWRSAVKQNIQFGGFGFLGMGMVMDEPAEQDAQPIPEPALPADLEDQK